MGRMELKVGERRWFSGSLVAVLAGGAYRIVLGVKGSPVRIRPARPRESLAISSAPRPTCPTPGHPFGALLRAARFVDTNGGIQSPAGAAALEVNQQGEVAKFIVVRDGALLDDAAITAAAAHVVDR